MVGLLEVELSCGYPLRRSWAADAMAHLGDIRRDWLDDERIPRSSCMPRPRPGCERGSDGEETAELDA